MGLTKILSSGKGFTLVQLVIVTAILGIVAEFIAHGMITRMPQQQLAEATKKVVWDLREARLQAISRNRSIKVTFLNDHEYAIWADNDKDGIVGTNEEKVIDIRPEYPHVKFEEKTINNLSFASRGTANNVSTITLTNPSGSSSVVVDLSGKVKIN